MGFGYDGLTQTLRETRAPMMTAGPEPMITRAVDDEPNHLVRGWPDAVHVGNDAPRASFSVQASQLPPP